MAGTFEVERSADVVRARIDSNGLGRCPVMLCTCKYEASRCGMCWEELSVQLDI